MNCMKPKKLQLGEMKHINYQVTRTPQLPVFFLPFKKTPEINKSSCVLVWSSACKSR